MGLLAPLARKNYGRSGVHRERRPTAVQRFINLTAWDADGPRDDVRAYDGVFRRSPGGADSRPDRVPEEGEEVGRGATAVLRDAWPGRQLSDRHVPGLRRTAPETALNDRELYMPERSGAPTPSGGPRPAVPEDLAFKTRPQQVQAAIDRTVEAGVPFAWPAADEEFGQNHKLRRHLEEQQIAHCMAVPVHRHHPAALSTATSDPAIIIALTAAQLNATTGNAACGIGSKGFRPSHHRGRDRGRRSPTPVRCPTKYQRWRTRILSLLRNPCREGLRELVRVIGSRWPTRSVFEAAKQEAGLAQYQFRLYRAWYCHITLAMLAMAFLAVLRHTAKRGPPLWTTGSDRQHTTDGSAAITGQSPDRHSTAGPATDQPVHHRSGVRST